MPDIDMDFCYNRRGEVIDYVIEKYGAEHVSQIVTFGTLAARAAVRDVGRALGLSYAEVDEVARAIPQELGMTIEKALSLPPLHDLYEQSRQVRQLIDTAKSLEGMPRNMSVHAAGILITEEPLWNMVPLAVSNGVVVSQYDMDTLHHLGLLKFDFLGLRYLTICHDAQTQIAARFPSFSPDQIPLDDAAAFALLSSGNTSGVFQLESAGIRQVLIELQPDRLDDVQAAIALYRPGPMDSIPTYMENRRHPEKITYPIPSLRDILSSTYGCIVYQEQVMNIFRIVAGYTYGHADVVRRAMAKKRADVLEAERDGFIAGAAKNGVDAQTATTLFEEMSGFAKYAFNQSHAASYALISYRTAYLKAHYPCEYMAALLTSVLDNIPKIGEYISQCTKMGIRVLPPDINESVSGFSASVSPDGSQQSIRFGLSALKNVGISFIQAAVAERERAGKYTSLADFIDRMNTDGNRRQVEVLIKAGAFDSLSLRRSQMLVSYERLLELRAGNGRHGIEGQLDLFHFSTEHTVETLGLSSQVPFNYPDLPEFSLRELLMQEKEAAGMYFSGQLLDQYSRHRAALQPEEIAHLLTKDEEGNYTVSERSRVGIAGIVQSVSEKTTRKQEKMAFITIADCYAEIECLIFPKQYAAYSPYLTQDAALFIQGNVSLRDEENPKLLVEKIEILVDDDHYKEEKKEKEEDKKEKKAENVQEKTPADRTDATPQAPVTSEMPKKLYLRMAGKQSVSWKKAYNLVELFEGKTPVIFYDTETSSYQRSPCGVALSQFVYEQFVTLLGKDNVVLR